MNKKERKILIENKFAEIFGSQPEIWVRAPGRVDLMGSHTDYNMGFVLTLAIDKDTWMALSPRNDKIVSIASLNIAGRCEFDLTSFGHDEEITWSNYVRGIAFAMQQHGFEINGFNGVIHSTIPFGSGLSSSAALEMVSAVAFKMVSPIDIDPVTMALFGQIAENQFVGVKTGILDQYSSMMGQQDKAIQLDCRNLTSIDVQIPSELVVVICDTRAERKLVGSEYDTRREQCEEGVKFLQQYYPSIKALRDVSIAEFEVYENDMPTDVAKRCRFIIEENNRVLELKNILPIGNLVALKQSFDQSYFGARDLFEIGAPAMESMYQAMSSAPGVVASRQTGAGFGGCMVSLVKIGEVEEFSEYVENLYFKRTGIKPHIYPVVASEGAGLIR